MRGYTLDSNGNPYGGQGAPRPAPTTTDGKPLGGWFFNMNQPNYKKIK